MSRARLIPALTTPHPFSVDSRPPSARAANFKGRDPATDALRVLDRYVVARRAAGR